MFKNLQIPPPLPHLAFLLLQNRLCLSYNSLHKRTCTANLDVGIDIAHVWEWQKMEHYLVNL